MGHFRPLFLYFRLFNTSNIKFADDWNQTADLWCCKEPLYQLSHNHCNFINVVSGERI